MVAFTVGQQLGPNDLKVELTDANGAPFDPEEIYYTFYGDPIKNPYQITGRSLSPWRVGLALRSPSRAAEGSYYVAEKISSAFLAGGYYVEWAIRRTSTSPLEIIGRKEFAVIKGV